MNTITTILFDLSEVLISGLMGFEKKFAAMVGMDAESLRSRFDIEEVRRVCRGEVTEDDYLRAKLKRERWRVPLRILKAVIRRNFRREEEGMVSLVESLSSRYSVVLVSDHVREWVEYIEKIHPFLQKLDRRIYSFDIGKTKDDPSCFPAVLSMLEKNGSECVFVDDTPVNVENARLAGIHGIVFRGREALEAEFSTLGIAVDGVES
jgi:putative hydrolase of the HAD superfamily